MRGKHAERGEHGRGGSDGAVRRGPELALDPVCERRAVHNQEPGTATAELASGEVAKPDARSKVCRQMPCVNVQGEGGPGAPPLAALQATRIQLSQVEGVEPYEAVSNGVSDTQQHRGIDQAADPRVRLAPPGGRRRY